jgi:FkbM family methyltransferase
MLNSRIILKRAVYVSAIFRELRFITAIKILVLHTLFGLGVIKGEKRDMRFFLNRSNLVLPVNKITIRTFLDTFVFKYHLPISLSENPKVILDFGSNIGLTCFDFALKYPQAEIYGYEIDARNVEMARALNNRNRKVCIQNLGVSDRPGWMFYNNSADSDAYSLTINHAEDPKFVKVPVESIATIFSSFENIDFVKIDIEGTELNTLRILKRIDVECVKEMVIEIHKQNESREIKNILEELGFRVEIHERHWSALRAIRD